MRIEAIFVYVHYLFRLENKSKLEYDIASDIRGLREGIQLTELKNLTIALSDHSLSMFKGLKKLSK